MNDRKLLTYAIFGVIAAAVFLLLTLKLASDPNVKANLGETQFRVGRADVLAAAISKEGALLFQDPTGKGPGLLLVHAGSDAEKGWRAVYLRGPRRRHCRLGWDPPHFPGRLVDGCEAETYAPNDPRLLLYPTRVVDGQVVVDVRAAPALSPWPTSPNSTRS